jgi:DNA end-binding protein Ku
VARTMARSIWKGVISFGMLSIPVRLYPATESKDVSFHQLHKECNSRLKQRKWCPVCDREVTQDEIVRGYEYAKGQYVMIEDEDLDKLPLASKHTIQLAAFVEAREIDPVYHEKSYYLEPDEVGLKPYALLLRALDAKGLSALASIAFRSRERLCALRAVDGVLLLDTLYYADEVRSDRRPQILAVKVSDRELEMAHSLIEALSEPFQAEAYHDQYREALMALIEEKLQGHEVVAQPSEGQGQVTDLMAALRASVEAARKRKDAPAALKAGRKWQDAPAAPPAKKAAGRRRKAAA